MKEILFILISVVVAFASPKDTTQKKTDIDDEKAMSHINYIQYSLNKIRYSRNKATINAELDDILNTINPTSLKYDALIDAYQSLTQSTLMSLKLNIEQEEALQAEISNKRSNALFNTFGGMGAAFLSPNPIALGMAAVQAGFNYARTQGEITTDSIKNANKLDAEAIRIIDAERTGIFLSAAKVFKDKEYENTHFINETMMQSLSQITFELDSVAKLDSVALIQENDSLKNIHKSAIKAITYLSEKDIYDLFELFLPYHLTLLKAHYYLTEIDETNYDIMDSIFNKIVEVSNTNYHRFYQKNLFLKEAAQYMILAEMQKNRSANTNFYMSKYIGYMEDNIQSTLENKINQKYFLTSIYEYMDRRDLTLSTLEYLRDVGAFDSKTSLLYNIYTTDCHDSNTKECEDLIATKEKQEKLIKLKEYTEEAETIFKKIKIFKHQKMWTVKSPIPLERVDAQCFVADEKAEPSDAKLCNSDMKTLKEYQSEYQSAPIYVYYFPDSYDRPHIYIKFMIEAKDVNDNWAFYGIIKQTTDNGGFKYILPDGIAR